MREQIMTKTMTAVCGAVVLVTGLFLPATAQEQGGNVIVRQRSAAGGAPVVIDQTRVQGEVRMKVPLEAKVVTGAPYSAEVISESVQVLPDGNRIVHQERSRVTRDSQGRVRREVDRDGQVTSVSISDPVAKVSYSLDPASRTAWKTPYGAANIVFYKATASTEADPAEIVLKHKIEQEMQQMVPPPPPPPPPPVSVTERRARALEAAAAAGEAVVVQGTRLPMRERNPGWEEKVEELAPRQVEGVQATGKRTTRTIPAGAIGNERPIVIVSEEWQSSELQVLVLTTTSDPRVGESVYKLQNINRAEPAPSLFEVPSDFTVKETGVRRVPTER
jgi:YD repeat-containing protein